MASNISTLIPAQITETIRESSPLFVSFLELYYKYAQERTNAIGVIQNTQIDSDIDTTLDVYIDEFYSIYGNQLPKTTTLDRRNLLKLLNEIYSSKGTEKSFKTLFRVLYGIETEYIRPSDQILKASDGKWVQDAFVTVQKNYGQFSALLNVEIPVSNSFGVFTFVASRYEDIGSGICRIFFRITSVLKFEIGSVIQIKDLDGVTTFRGNVIESPERLNIISGGGLFQSGQVYSIPGSTQPTVFKIKRVDVGGKIKSAEIISHGYTHPQHEQYWISSYKNIPPLTNQSVVSTETSPGVFLYEIGITDTIYDIRETIVGRVADIYDDVGFGLDTVEFNTLPVFVITVGDTLFSAINGGEGLPATFASNPSITIQDYLNNRASVELISGSYSNLPGRYTDTSGQLSDPFIKLQDNYYYQIFSYVVLSGIDISAYKDTILKALHPAGLKYFAVLSKSLEIDVSASIIADAKYTHRLNFSDDISLSDVFSKLSHKNIETFLNVLQSYALEDYFLEDYAFESGFDDSIGVITGNTEFVINGSDQVFFGIDQVVYTPY
jgi:hypothetical protein